jgi:PAS domain S-box-containing protein
MSFEQENRANLLRLKVAFLEAHAPNAQSLAAEFFERLHQNMPGILFTVDPSDAVLTINPLGAKALGYEVEELVGKPITDILIADERDLMLNQLALCRQDAGRVYIADFQKVRKDGSLLWVREAACAFPFEERMVTLVLCEDITDRKMLERQLHDQFDKLKELDHLKTNFVNSVTHELRTPLTSIMGYAEFLEDGIGGALNPEQLEFVHQLQEGSKRLERLLNDLLDFARLEAGTFRITKQRSDLGEKIREIASSLMPQAREAQLELDVRLPETPLLVSMDSPRIGQVLYNLIGNAIKFTAPGGTIIIRGSAQGAQVLCEVVDVGIGIPAQDLPLLFQRFTQLEAGLSKGVGAGLGLSISKAIIEAHGGTIGVFSELGKGSTFWFRLPRATVPADQLPPPPTPAA